MAAGLHLSTRTGRSGLTVAEIAHRLGYTASPAFTHAFTRWTGPFPARVPPQRCQELRRVTTWSATASRTVAAPAPSPRTRKFSVRPSITVAR